MRALLLIAALFAAALQPALAQSSTVTGTWSGVLNVSGQPLLFVIDIQQKDDGLSAVASSPYQGGGTIPVDSIRQSGNILTFSIAKLGVSFTGTLSGEHIDGTFTQNGVKFPLMLLANSLGTADFEGAWLGTLHVGGTGLPLVIRISQISPGSYSGVLDSPAQHGFGIPLAQVQAGSGALSFTVPAVSASYTGKVQGEDIVGTFTQNGTAFPLTFARPQITSTASAVQPTPLPTAPPHFRSRDVHFTSDGAVLAGTLTTPHGAHRKLPAFIFIHGSGPGTRDGGIEENPTFLFLGNALSNNGIVVLRYDKRGIGQSTGKATEDWRPLSGDVRAAIAFLQRQPQVDPRRIYLLGHSEGGLIAPLVAAHAHDVAGIVLLAPPAVPMSTILQEQSTRVTAAMFAAEKRAFADYNGIDPAKIIQQVNAPILVLQGTADMQVLPSDLHHLVDAARAAHKRITVDMLSGDDHLFIRVPPGVNEPAEYFTPHALDPRVPKDILAWLRAS